jgi:pilin isopeptide linkage protein/LPXTG-motif cell wall-anchored protein
VKNGGYVTFDKLTYSKVGTYNYTITEVDGGVKGFEYDTEPHKVTVTVTDPDKDGILKAAVEYEDGEVATIVNPFIPEFTSVKVKKVWDDKDDKDGIRPTAIRVSLYRDGKLEETVTLSEDNNWKYTWKDLLKECKGKEVKYTVKEVKTNKVNGKDGAETYAISYSGNAKSGFVITNKHTPVPEPVPKKTGDENNLAGWIALMMLASAGSYVVIRRRRNNQ